MLHEARADFGMLLGALYLLIEGAGAWSLDAMLARTSRPSHLRETVMIDRRSLLKYAALVPLMSATPRLAWTAGEKADYTLRIGTGLVELAPGHIVRSITASSRDRCAVPPGTEAEI
jgi:hypothetical protein